MFEWQFDRAKTISQWVLGGAASLSISVLISVSQKEWKLPTLTTAIIVASALLTGVYGAYVLWQLRSLSRQFIAALKLYAALTGVKPFVARYRDRAATGKGQR